MKILCFGDSNTYGYDPCSYFGGRRPTEQRWVDLLARQLGCTAVNAGENGREIPSRAGELRRFDRLLTEQAPVDLLIIMLGTNDLLQGNSPEAVTQRMERFLEHLPLERSKILLIAPPPMKLGAWVPTQSLVDSAAELSRTYQVLSERLGIACVCAGDWDLSLEFDGVHLTAQGQMAFARKLLECNIISQEGLYVQG